MSWPHPIQAIIFDCDGLLIDSEGIFAQAMKDLTGFELTTDLHLKIMGTRGPECGKILMDAHDIKGDPKEFMANFDKHLNTLLPKANMLPGAKELIEKFAKMGLPMGIATGSNRCNYDAKVVKHGETMKNISVIVCGDEVSKGKPNPEIFLKTMEKLGFEHPENCLVFEDSPGGIKAAVDAGFPCVMVPDKDFPYQRVLDNYGVKPTYMLNSLEEFELSMFDFSQIKKE